MIHARPRRTKILATVGPASESETVLSHLIEAGVNVFRLNFSHGNTEQHIAVAKRIRKVAAQAGRYVGILADLQGPKIRIKGFKNGVATLTEGTRFRLDLRLGQNDGDEYAVGLEYEELCRVVSPGDILLLDDGRIKLCVQQVEDSAVDCTVTTGGMLSARKGINRLGGGFSAPALTDKDKADIKSFKHIKPDFVAVSFVSSAEDIHVAQRLLAKEGLAPAIIAKIERAEAVYDKTILAEIMRACFGVMVARGDLGVEVGDAQLIGLQKELITRARSMDKVVITATQMMESMINNSMPTRAEVFDVANAVLDGTDAVMLSAETATGKYPVDVVKAMADSAQGAERHPSALKSRYRLERQFSSFSETIAMSAMYAANHYGNVRGIACLTESGTTPLLMSRLSSGLPIFGLSKNPEILQRLCICRGVIPLFFDASVFAEEEVQDNIIEFLKDGGYLNTKDDIIFTRGSEIGRRGGTDMLKILPVQ